MTPAHGANVIDLAELISRADALEDRIGELHAETAELHAEAERAEIRSEELLTELAISSARLPLAPLLCGVAAALCGLAASFVTYLIWMLALRRDYADSDTPTAVAAQLLILAVGALTWWLSRGPGAGGEVRARLSRLTLGLLISSVAVSAAILGIAYMR